MTAPVDEVARAIESAIGHLTIVGRGDLSGKTVEQWFVDSDRNFGGVFVAGPFSTRSEAGCARFAIGAQAAMHAMLARMRDHAAAEQSANGDFIVKWIDAYAKECGL